MKLANCFAILFLPLWTHAAPPEMWVVPLDHKIPSVSPAGRTNFQLGFVLRVCGTQKTEQMVALYQGIGVHLRDSSGKEIASDFVRNNEFAPTLDDFVVVTSGKVRQRCYVITMQGGVLSISDGTGGVRTFKVSPGKITAEVMFDARPLANYDYLAPFEEKYFGWDRRKVFRGPINCGKFEIEVGAEK